MDEIKIGAALEKKIEREEKVNLNDALKIDDNSKNRDGRNIILMIVIMVGIFVFFMGGFKVYDYFTGANVVSLDYLHQKNSEGKLDESRGYMYNGYSFVYNDNIWWTEIQKNNILTKIPLHFGPKNLTDVKVMGMLNPDFNKGELVYVAIDPEFANKYYTLALSEINFNIVKGILRKPEAVCTKNNTICDDRKILNCDNTEGKPVIELRNAEKSEVTFKGTCILVSGNETGIVQAANRLVLKWYGIMP